MHDCDKHKSLLFALQPSKGFRIKLRGRVGNEVSLLVSMWEWVTGGSAPLKTPTPTWEHKIPYKAGVPSSCCALSHCENNIENSILLSTSQHPVPCGSWWQKWQGKMNYGAHMVGYLFLLLANQTLILIGVKICPIPEINFYWRKPVMTIHCPLSQTFFPGGEVMWPSPGHVLLREVRQRGLWVTFYCPSNRERHVWH